MSLARRKVFIAVAVLAVIGAIVGIIVWQTGSKSSDKATSGSGNNSGSSSNNSTSGGSTTTSPSTGVDTQPSTGAGNSSDAGSSSGFSDGAKKSTITSDPTKAKYSVNMYAIGDWGTTVTRDSCCKRRGDHTPTNVDKNAEDLVAKVMGMAAASTDLKPKVVIGHGDNFYWGGLMGKTDQAYRFDKTFESKFNAKSLEGIPWINVLGNHDYGGASFVCSSGSDYVKCGSTAELLAALDTKFTLQSSYVSPNGNRWITKDHFFVHTIEDAASGVTIDIFNMDTNDADSHGAHQICCQCYGYSSGSSKCNDVHVGDAWCAGGDVGMYNACMDKISAWGKDSRDQFKKLVAKSTATWKIVNTHYSPYNHYAEAKQDMWWELLKDSGIQLYISGHTHGEKHDYSKYGIHFILNGAGGGILNEAADDVPEYARTHVKKIWQYPTYDYGFFELKASKEWLRASFLTNDAAWNVADDFSQSTVGGVATKHCWYIPVDGTEGKACTAAS